MVVHTFQWFTYRTSYDEYWKITNWNAEYAGKIEMKNQLQHLRYKVPSFATKSRLTEALTRQWRGLLSYDGCTLRELKRFCAQRAIRVSHDCRLTKARLAEALEAADGETEFSRFMDLPPELRVLVYTLYFSSLPELEQPVEPTISKVSRTTRKESLPVFFKTCTFVVHRRRSYASNCWSTRRKGDFIQSISETHIGLIRHLWIEFKPPGVKRYKAVRWSQGDMSFDWTESRTIDYDALDKPFQLGQDLAHYLKDIQGSSKGRVLQRADIVELEERIRKCSDRS